ncbi:MAG: EF-P lysine aminoacylase EpmA [Halioglobus sp.]
MKSFALILAPGNTRGVQESPDRKHWKPGANHGALRARAALLADIRAYFLDHNVLEVETPLLCERGVTDPAIEPLCVTAGTSIAGPRYLQSSPEYAMKRLLAAGAGPIYQISKAFRDGEAGSRHNPEFSLLEWYQPGFDHHQMMAQVEELVLHCLGPQSMVRFSYRELFLKFLNIDPFVASCSDLEVLAREKIEIGFQSDDRDLWLDLLMSHLIEPAIANLDMCFVYDYPPSQAALSRIASSGDVEVGQRFELYINGLELANGYCELTDAKEQRARFIADNARRKQYGQLERPIDELLLFAMEQGLPACSGVALGVDRLLMIATGISDIRQLLAFDWNRC